MYLTIFYILFSGKCLDKNELSYLLNKCIASGNGSEEHVNSYR